MIIPQPSSHQFLKTTPKGARFKMNQSYSGMGGPSPSATANFGGAPFGMSPMQCQQIPSNLLGQQVNGQMNTP
jgi:hypothetical protein